MIGADSVREAYPLFNRMEGGGAIPTSALQLNIGKIDICLGVRLNKIWHSRLPELTNWQGCIAFGAFFESKWYAVGIWGRPIARMLNGKNWLELRRMAIAPDAPKNTASRMISIMIKMIKRDRPEIVKLISYQDCDVHLGTIYKASNWQKGLETKNITTGWNSRDRNQMQTTSNKIRWEYEL